jgi:hypothetical protein
MSAPAPEPDLRAHVSELHAAALGRAPKRMTLSRLGDWHAEQHHRYVPRSHHHGPNPGSHARPPGWRTGGDVTLLRTGD